jgi:hypothetical protein
LFVLLVHESFAERAPLAQSARLLPQLPGKSSKVLTEIMQQLRGRYHLHRKRFNCFFALVVFDPALQIVNTSVI